MFSDPQSTFYTVLAISIALLTIFLCSALLYLVLILRDASKVIEKTRDTVEKINSFVVKPVALASMVVDRVRPIIESIVEERAASFKKRKK